MSTYLGALEAVAEMSPDHEGSPGYQKQRARLNSRLVILLERLEHDRLGFDLVARSEDDEATIVWTRWKKRFSELCDSLDEHFTTKRRNNGGGVGQAKELLKVVDQQLNRLRDELDAGNNTQPLAKNIDDLQRQVTEFANLQINDSGIVINIGGNPRSLQEAQYQAFWGRGASIIQRFRVLVKFVEEGSYDEQTEGAKE